MVLRDTSKNANFLMPIDREHDLTLKELWEPGLTNLLGQKPKDLLAAGIKPLAQQAREAEAPKTKKEGKKKPKEVRWDKAEVRIEHKPPSISIKAISILTPISESSPIRQPLQ